MKFQILLCFLLFLNTCNRGSSGKTTTARKPSGTSKQTESEEINLRCRNIRNRFIDSKKVGDELVFIFEKVDGEELDIEYDWNDKSTRKAKRDLDGKYWKFTFTDLPTTDNPKIAFKCTYLITPEMKQSFQLEMRRLLTTLTKNYLFTNYKLKQGCINNYNLNYDTCLSKVLSDDAFYNLTKSTVDESRILIIKLFGLDPERSIAFLQDYWKNLEVEINSEGKVLRPLEVNKVWGKIHGVSKRLGDQITLLLESAKPLDITLSIDQDTPVSIVTLEDQLYKVPQKEQISSKLLECGSVFKTIQLEDEITDRPKCGNFQEKSFINNYINIWNLIIKIKKFEIETIETPSVIWPETKLFGYENSPLKAYVPDNRIALTTGIVFTGLFNQDKFQDFMIPIMAQFNITKILKTCMFIPVLNTFSLDIGHGVAIADTPDPRNDVQLGKNWLFGFSFTASGISLSAGFYVFENKENEKFNTTLYLGITLDLQKAAWLLRQFGFTDGQVPTLK